jgi:hypothetical protein
MIPLRTLQATGEIMEKQRNKMCSVDQFTIADDKILIEIFEKNGGQTKHSGRKSDLIKARLINDMHQILVIH